MTAIKKGLTANTLKYIAILAMLIDHVAWAFVPTYSVLGQVMHIIGRTTAPIMCFFIAEGYYHTRNVKKYALRLFVFTLIIYIPFLFPFVRNMYGGFPPNVLLTLLLGLLALCAWNKINNPFLRILTVVLLCIFSVLGDWPIFGVLFILAFGLNRNNFKMQALSFSIIAIIMVAISTYFSLTNGYSIYRQLFQLAVLLALPLLYFYNGERGSDNKFNKWVFYIFYPLHLLIIGIFEFYIFV